ncbi:D-arabinono-1,4-lactone oxidase [soil metagenome]
MPTFRNWARTVESHPSAWVSPESEDELAEVIRRSRRVRVVGAGHSWSPIAAPEDVGVRLDKLAGVPSITRERVVVRAGTRLGELNAALAAHGLALPIVGSIDAQTVAGLVATGTHGSSLAHGNLASFVRRMTVLDGRGERVEIDPGGYVHLGALGVVIDVELIVVPAFRLAETVETIPVRDVYAQVETIARSAEYVKVWWMPHARDAHVFRYERTTDPPSPAAQRTRWLDNRMHQYVFPSVLRLARFPRLVPHIGRAIARTFAKPRRVGPSTLMLSTPMPARHRETEAALPLARAGEALERAVRIVGDMPVNFLTELRFVRGDQMWLSPATGGDTAQLGAYCQGACTDAYFAAFWREMRALGARPHWGKELDHTADEIRALWSEHPRFVNLRDKLDPERRYGSSFLSRVLGD